MPVAIVQLEEKNNRVINIVKARYGLHDKSAAINKLVEEYARLAMPTELRPEYIQKLKRIEKEKSIPIHDVDAYFSRSKK